MIRTREASAITIVLLLGVQTLLILLLTTYVFGNRPLANLYYRTSGLVQPTLFYGALALGVGVVGILFGHGRLRPRDVGLVAARLPTALVVTIAIWAAVHLALLLARVIAPGQGSPAGAAPSLLPLLGAFLAAAAGMSLYEEIVFRGFLFPQFYLKLKTFRDRPRARLGLATFFSQTLFAVVHLPVMVIYQRLPGLDLLIELFVLTLVGTLAVLLYLRTNNLFIVVGVHSLANAPVALLDAPIDPVVVVVAIAIGILLLWPRRWGAAAQSWGADRSRAS